MLVDVAVVEECVVRYCCCWRECCWKVGPLAIVDHPPAVDVIPILVHESGNGSCDGASSSTIVLLRRLSIF